MHARTPSMAAREGTSAEKSIRWLNQPCVITCYRANARMSDRKAVIKNADMAEEMQQDAVDCATQALEKFNIEKVIFSGSARFFVTTVIFCAEKVQFNLQTDLS
ncbi:Hypothetical predicted protein [Cloeon dipterum]|uniref:Dynein light chain n=1 Tax=Cloeon dipterum TaxID=197152 RepID=A0A8S1D155_9INSE|nr:Hypothetical predicted protein [Cloeon dipterum]